MKALSIFFLAQAMCISLAVAEAAQPSGRVVGWGGNTVGQATGIPSGISANSATGLVSIAGETLNDATAVAAGNFHGLALKADGTVAGWGGNWRGTDTGRETPSTNPTGGLVTVDGKVLSNIVAVAAGNCSLGLRRDGTIAAWGRTTVPSGLSNVIAIATKHFTSLALKRDGTVVGWSSASWRHAEVPEGLTNVVAISVGGGDNNVTRYAALKRDGTVVSWGTYSDLASPVGLSNVVAIAAGYNHSLALKEDGTVVGWGFNGQGQATGVISEEGQRVSKGVVRIDGKILTNVVSIAAGEASSLAVTRDGQLVAWGDKRFTGSIPSHQTGVFAAACGRGFCLAITTNANSFLPPPTNPPPR